MNFFESELRKIMGNSNIVDNMTFVGRSCFGEIGKDLRARIEFAIDGTIDHYSALRITILNRTSGTVDQMKIRLDEILGIQPVTNSNFPDGISPYIWIYRSKPEWYVFKPGPDDYKKIGETIRGYVDVFRTREERKPALDASINQAKQQNASQKKAAYTKNTKLEPER